MKLFKKVYVFQVRFELQEVENWELMSKLIYERESVLAELESFERYASDPSRLFNQGSFIT